MAKPKNKTNTIRISEAHRRAFGPLAEVEGRRLDDVVDEPVESHVSRPEKPTVSRLGIQWPAEWDPNEGWPTDPALEEGCVRLGKPRKPSGAVGGQR